jgi:tricorn protease
MRSLQRAIFCLLALTVRLYGVETRFARQPDIHGDRIVFVAEDDLWLLPASGGRAERITTHPGSESNPRFSPDGKWIAFTASYDGGVDVYAMPSSGGTPVRLTFHPAADEVVEWLPDGKSILFRSPRTVEREAYTVPLSGGFQPPFPAERIRHASFSPDGSRFVMTRSDADRMFWRGYKGGDQPDLWIVDRKTGAAEKVTDYRGYDIRPMWHKNGIFFLSDRDGRMNLYSLDPATRRVVRRTDHRDWDAEDASLGGDRIVYCCGGRLRVYDIPADRSASIDLDLPSDRWQSRPTMVDPSEFVQEAVLSKDGKAAAVQARGDVYRLEERTAVNLTETPGSNEFSPALSPDGKWIAFFSDRDGDNALYIAPPSGKGEWIRLTKGLGAWPYRPLWSPDSRKLCFGDNLYALHWIDIGAKELVTADRTRYQRDNEIYWEVAEYDWSPDSRWIAYSKCEANMNSSIFLYDTASRRVVRVTDDRYDDTWPAFDRNGGLLYFLSLRNFDPMLDPFMDNHVNGGMSVVLAVTLNKDAPPPFDREPGDGEEAEDKEAAAGGAARGATAPAGIDTAGISERVFAAPVPAGTYTRLQAGTDGCFFLSREAYGFPGWFEFVHPRGVTDFTLQRFDAKTKRTGGSFTASAITTCPETAPESSICRAASRVSSAPPAKARPVTGP